MLYIHLSAVPRVLEKGSEALLYGAAALLHSLIKMTDDDMKRQNCVKVNRPLQFPARLSATALVFVFSLSSITVSNCRSPV